MTCTCRGITRVLHSKQIVRKMLVRENSKAYSHREQPYVAADDVKPNYYESAYGLASCQQLSTANTYHCQVPPYPPAPNYCSQRLEPDISQHGYQPQLNQEHYPNAPYPNVHDTTWYPNINVPHKHVENLIQPKQHIRNWLQDVEENSHLQNSFKKIENEVGNMNEKEDNSNYFRHQCNAKDSWWESRQTVHENKQRPLEYSQQSYSSIPQLPLLKHCAMAKTNEEQRPTTEHEGSPYRDDPDPPELCKNNG